MPRRRQPQARNSNSRQELEEARRSPFPAAVRGSAALPSLHLGLLAWFDVMCSISPRKLVRSFQPSTGDGHEVTNDTDAYSCTTVVTDNKGGCAHGLCEGA